MAGRLAAFDLVELAMFVRKLEQATGGSRAPAPPLGDPQWLMNLKRVAKKTFAAKA